MEKSVKRILVVGGVAGGASAAARARRLDEESEIVIFDKGAHVSFANCGLPYYVGDVIQDESKLLVATPELFQTRFNIQVRLKSEVTRIDPVKKRIEVMDLESGRVYEESYDALVLSPGASPLRPPVPGINAPGVFVLRTIPDSRRIREFLTARNATRAVVVGGGFIGLEMAENLSHRGLETTVIELSEQVMPPLDPEMAAPMSDNLLSHGVKVVLGDGLSRIEEVESGLVLHTQSGLKIETDLVLLATGVKPETALAKSAGLVLGERGGIVVDERQRTSVPDIWAVGDAIEVRESFTGVQIVLPLAGPANRQGRIAANDIFGRDTRFRGVQGTAVCGAYGLTVAMTGCSEKSLKKAGITDYERIYLHPGHHVGYYPGAKPIHLKLIYRRSDGRVLGAQAVGESGVVRRIDVIAMAIQMGATVHDLEEAELCYAPQYGAAKDPVNIAGMIAANVMQGDSPLAHWEDLPQSSALVLDVRNAAEREKGAVSGSVNIPLGELRERLAELPQDRPIWVHCQVGQRAYFATRVLRQNGFDAHNLSGGYATYEHVAASQASGNARK